VTKISEPKIQRLEIVQIETESNRLRPVSKAGVQSLMASIEELGIIKDAIHVRRKGRGDDARLILMAGAHRLRAATQLGWVTIPARIWSDVTDDFARLMEIDDNLSGADLSNLELSVFLAERKRVYERLHPEAKQGAFKGNQHTGKVAAEIISFASSVAEKRELSARHIRNFIQIGNALTQEQATALAASEQPLKLKDLMALAKISEADLRDKVVGQFTSGEAASVADAMEKVQPTKAPAPDPVDAAFQSLLTAWRRAPMAGKRRFLDELEGEITPLLGLEGDDQ